MNDGYRSRIALTYEYAGVVVLLGVLATVEGESGGIYAIALGICLGLVIRALARQDR